jgi:cytochrome c5
MLRALHGTEHLAGQAATPPGSSKSSAIVLPAGEGMELTKKLCSGCHGTDTFARQRHDRAQWNQILDNMMSKGMDASDDDLDKVATYLAAHFGPDAPAATAATMLPAKLSPHAALRDATR